MVESIVDEPTDCSTMEPQLRGDEASPVTLSVIIPMFDEADGVDRLFAELEQFLALAECSYEIICVNDGSRDETLKRLIVHRRRNCAIKIINLSRNFGKDIALTAGMIYSCGSAVLPFDADLQDPPNLIPVMLERWREGYEIVNAVRRCREDGLLKRIGATLFYRLYNAIADMKIPPEVGDFRLIDRKVVNILKQFPERTRFMKGLFAWVGFRQIEICNEPGFALCVNGERVYCRGACWTTNDIFTLSGSEESVRQDLQLAPEHARCLLDVLHLELAVWIVRIDEQP